MQTLHESHITRSTPAPGADESLVFPALFNRSLSLQERSFHVAFCWHQLRMNTA